jgi:hypothetical protein
MKKFGKRIDPEETRILLSYTYSLRMRGERNTGVLGNAGHSAEKKYLVRLS